MCAPPLPPPSSPPPPLWCDAARDTCWCCCCRQSCCFPDWGAEQATIESIVDEPDIVVGFDFAPPATVTSGAGVGDATVAVELLPPPLPPPPPPPTLLLPLPPPIVFMLSRSLQFSCSRRAIMPSVASRCNFLRSRVRLACMRLRSRLMSSYSPGEHSDRVFCDNSRSRFVSLGFPTFLSLIHI